MTIIDKNTEYLDKCYEKGKDPDLFPDYYFDKRTSNRLEFDISS